MLPFCFRTSYVSIIFPICYPVGNPCLPGFQANRHWRGPSVFCLSLTRCPLWRPPLPAASLRPPETTVCVFFSPGFSIAGVRFGGFNLCRFLLDVVGYYWMYHYHFIIMILTSVTRAASDLMSEKPCHSHVAVEERTHVLLDTRWFGGLGGFNQTSARTSDGNARLRGRYPQLGALNKLCTSLKLEGAKCGLLSSNMVNQYILRAYTYWFSMSEQSLNSYLDAKI